MKEITNYKEVFETIVEKTKNYILENNLKTMVLGISGGIDSTVVAAICHEVETDLGWEIEFIGRSLPSKYNKSGEIDSALLVGKAFCREGNFEEVPIKIIHDTFTSYLKTEKYDMTSLANGNIQARLRMTYLYHLAGITRGLVMDTDNLTENNLGYFTVHGDQGDFNPIGGLWKTEVFKLAEYLVGYYRQRSTVHHRQDHAEMDLLRAEAIEESLKLKPTAGLGITDTDLDELGADSYEQVDGVLQEILAWKWLVSARGDEFESRESVKEAFLDEQQMLDTPIKVIINVTNRHFASEFKRTKLPIVIPREVLT